VASYRQLLIRIWTGCMDRLGGDGMVFSLLLVIRILMWYVRLFIIDGIITLPLAILGYVFFPNLPQADKKTWWITDAEHEISKERMKVVGRVGKQPWTKAKAKRILLSWHTYLLREFCTCATRAC
jgi:hypothetical protein